METSTGTTSRKAEHLRINLEEDVSAKGVTSGFERYRFVPRTLPEIDLAEVSTVAELFGRRLGAPIFISCMTGGVPEAGIINRTLARVAQRHGLALGLGSGRVLLEHPEALPSFDVREFAPDVPVFANIGAVQLNRGVGVDECRRLVDLLRADALVLHLNALQEALQPDGDTTFRGILGQIARLCERLEVPVIAKEVGWGIAPDVARALLDAGVTAVDVAGAGGTSWSEVERHRMADPIRRRVAAAFADWGLPTADAVRLARGAAPDALIFASGGIRSGMDAAKAIALGADMVGMAGPFLRAASRGEEEAGDLATELVETVRTVMFCIGAPTVSALHGTSRLVPVAGPGLSITTTELTLGPDGPTPDRDVTEEVAAAVARAGIQSGLVQCFLQHSPTAFRPGEPLLRNAALVDIRADGHALDGTGSVGLTLAAVDSHRAQALGPLEGAATVAAPVVDGRLQLGSGGRILVVGSEAPRERRVTVLVLGQ